MELLQPGSGCTACPCLSCLHCLSLPALPVLPIPAYPCLFCLSQPILACPCLCLHCLSLPAACLTLALPAQLSLLSSVIIPAFVLSPAHRDVLEWPQHPSTVQGAQVDLGDGIKGPLSVNTKIGRAHV